jgi:hypothetical protein
MSAMAIKGTVLLLIPVAGYLIGKCLMGGYYGRRKSKDNTDKDKEKQK